MTKADLAKLHTSALYVLGGADDIAQPNGMDDFQRINPVPVFVADKKNAGHFGVFIEPNGRGTEIEIDWMKWQLENDQVAKVRLLATTAGSATSPAGRCIARASSNGYFAAALVTPC